MPIFGNACGLTAPYHVIHPTILMLYELSSLAAGIHFKILFDGSLANFSSLNYPIVRYLIYRP
jgi:hypothetical protein